MKKFIVLVVCVLIGACTEDATTQEQDFEALTNTFNSLQETASSIPCTDASQWRFTPYGAKACGGPQGYLAYPITIDTVDFLNRIEGYRIREDYLNRKWNVFSTCDVPPAPVSVDCVNGIAVLVY